MISTILFDFGGVLGSDSDEWETNFKEIPYITKIPVVEIEQLFSGFWSKLKIGEIDLDVFWKQVYQMSDQEIAKGTLEGIYKEKSYIKPEIMEFTKEINQKGYRIAILANESKQGMSNKIDRFHLNELFEKVYWFCIFRSSKTRQRSILFTNLPELKRALEGFGT